MNRHGKVLVFAFGTASIASPLCIAQSQAASAALPVTKVVLFSSGVGYFEHRGQVTGDSLVSLPFASDEVNDALKSLVVSDGSAAGDKAASPSVSYPSGKASTAPSRASESTSRARLAWPTSSPASAAPRYRSTCPRPSSAASSPWSRSRPRIRA